MTQCWNGASWARTQTGPATYGPKLSTSGFPVTGKAERRKKLWRVQMSFHCRGSWLLKSYCIKLSHNMLMHLECIFPNPQHIIHVNMGISRNFHYKPSSYWGSHGYPHGSLGARYQLRVAFLLHPKSPLSRLLVVADPRKTPCWRLPWSMAKRTQTNMFNTCLMILGYSEFWWKKMKH